MQTSHTERNPLNSITQLCPGCSQRPPLLPRSCTLLRCIPFPGCQAWTSRNQTCWTAGGDPGTDSRPPQLWTLRGHVHTEEVTNRNECGPEPDRWIGVWKTAHLPGPGHLWRAAFSHRPDVHRTAAEGAGAAGTTCSWLHLRVGHKKTWQKVVPSGATNTHWLYSFLQPADIQPMLYLRRKMAHNSRGKPAGPGATCPELGADDEPGNFQLRPPAAAVSVILLREKTTLNAKIQQTKLTPTFVVSGSRRFPRSKEREEARFLRELSAASRTCADSTNRSRSPGKSEETKSTCGR